jgi:hypothetical protein
MLNALYKRDSESPTVSVNVDNALYKVTEDPIVYENV